MESCAGAHVEPIALEPVDAVTVAMLVDNVTDALSPHTNVSFDVAAIC